MSEVAELPIREDLYVGIDGGGTTINEADTQSSEACSYKTGDFANMDKFIDVQCEELGGIPVAIEVGLAGSRDDVTGVISLTNNEDIDWPPFDPRATSRRLGNRVRTRNDMVIAMAGVLQEGPADWQELTEDGEATETGNRVVVTHSTGIGTAAAVWDEVTEKWVIMQAEGGHTGWQPKDEFEFRYLRHLNKMLRHASAELSLSGFRGIDNLINYSLVHAGKKDKLPQESLLEAIEEARLEKEPVGAVVVEFATQGEGSDQAAAHIILSRMGAIVGGVLRDKAVDYKATGGIYATGSMAHALWPYMFKHTELKQRFVREGATHDDWIEKIPINLVIDPHVGAIGALALAKGDV